MKRINVLELTPRTGDYFEHDGGKVFPILGGLPAERLEQSHSQAVQERCEANTQQAIDAGVFGVPSHVIDGELFWGQDGLDFVERKLKAGS